MEEEEEQTTTIMTRIFVGGLGDKVTSDDISKTFSKLGVVHSVDIIRTKGRSFAYINFLPSSQKSLSKLFSTVCQPGEDHRDDKIHDSIIQDCGVHVEEISMMDSVLKKLQEKMVSPSVNQEEIIQTNDVDDGADDGDIQINASSRNLERQKSLPFEEEANDVDDETKDLDNETDDDDDDDIQINAVGSRN